MSLYSYLWLNQDGSTVELEPQKKLGWRELQSMVGGTFEIIPSDYYKGLGYGRCTMYGNEEARFDSDNIRNPFFKVLAPGFDVVGNILMEKVYHEA